MSASETLGERARELLSETGRSFDAVKTYAEALAWLRERRAVIVAVDLDLRALALPDDALELMELLNQRSRETCGLWLTRARISEEQQRLFSQGVKNFLAIDEAGELELGDLVATLDKVFSADIFGLDRYLPEAIERVEHTLHESRERLVVANQAEVFARGSGCHPQIAQDFAISVDELVSNAFMAPQGVKGSTRAAAPVIVRFAREGGRLGLSVTDEHGTLTATRVLASLKRCFRRSGDQIEWKAEGAGIGLYCVFNSLQHIVFNLSPGARTEVIGLIEITRSYRAYIAKPKSFNVFIAEGGARGT